METIAFRYTITCFECNFPLMKFREYFSDLMGVSRFKFNADMGLPGVWERVKVKKYGFTIGDLLKVYYGVNQIIQSMIIRFVNGINF